MQKGLPNRFYTTREDFLLEREMIFSSMWTCIGFASDTSKPGDAFPFEFMELPLLILRGEDGQLRVFHNVCPHRGHILVSEPGRMKKMLRCPYHSWTFQLDGKLANTPHIGGVGVRELENFDPTCHGMREIRSEVWNDLVFINLDGEAESFSQFIQPLEKRWKQFWGTKGPGMLKRSGIDDRIDFKLETNWKLVVENYLEAYHLPTIHPALNRVSR
ncbi:MAG: aromatic ring-hydroxylating dioxygenase subunit alpha [bacterium]